MLTISKFANAGGVGVETIRYYQRRGLLAEPERGEGIRRYNERDLQRLRLIRSAQAAGFTLSCSAWCPLLHAARLPTTSRHHIKAARPGGAAK